MAEDWWAEPAKVIYSDALAELGGDEDPLEHGPGHLVWADSNFEDDHLRFALDECESRREEWVERYGAAALDVVRRSLERLAAIPEEVRDVPDPHCDDDMDTDDVADQPANPGCVLCWGHGVAVQWADETYVMAGVAVTYPGDVPAGGVLVSASACPCTNRRAGDQGELR